MIHARTSLEVGAGLMRWISSLASMKASRSSLNTTMGSSTETFCPSRPVPAFFFRSLRNAVSNLSALARSSLASVIHCVIRWSTASNSSRVRQTAPSTVASNSPKRDSLRVHPSPSSAPSARSWAALTMARMSARIWSLFSSMYAKTFRFQKGEGVSGFLTTTG